MHMKMISEWNVRSWTSLVAEKLSNPFFVVDETVLVFETREQLFHFLVGETFAKIGQQMAQFSRRDVAILFFVEDFQTCVKRRSIPIGRALVTNPYLR